MTNVLSSKSVLASLEISAWTARKYDRKISDETNARHNASSDAGRYNKLLIAKEAIDGLVKLGGAARLFHYSLTLPWTDKGPRILPTENFVKWSNGLREMGRDHNIEADKFYLNYPAMVAEARNRLNGMFDPADYPPVSQIRGRFVFSTDVLPFPDVSDFRVNLGAAHMDEIKSDMEARLRGALETAMRDARDRVLKTVGHMAEKLRAYKPAMQDGDKVEGMFRDSLVENVRELVDVLPAFNLTDDTQLARIIDQMRNELTAYDATELRESDALRQTVAKQAESILAQAQAFMA